MYEYLIYIIEHHGGGWTSHTYRLEAFGLPRFVWLIMVSHINIDATTSAASVARKIPCVGGTYTAINITYCDRYNKSQSEILFFAYVFKRFADYRQIKRIRSANMISRASMAIPQKKCTRSQRFLSVRNRVFDRVFLLCSRTNYDG